MAPPSPRNILLSRAGLICIAFLAHLPILVQYTLRMWRAEHYQFFPLLIVGLAWFFVSDFRELISDTKPGNFSIVAVLLAGVTLCLLLGTLVNSSFLGAISTWLLLATSCYWLWGNKGLRRCMPFLVLLLLIVPLPVRLDAWIIFKMQFIASHLASLLLDSFGCIHFREGVVLATESDKFMTQEACSGIRSLFSSLAGIGLYCLIHNHPLWRYIFNFTQAVVWVLVGNALRIALVVFISENYTTAVSTGWGHEVLGLASLFFILLMAVSTDRMLQFFVMQTRCKTSNGSIPRQVGSVESDLQTRFFSQIEFPKFSMIYHFGFAFVFAIGLLIGIQNFGHAGSTWVTGLPRLSFPIQSDLNLAGGEVGRFEHVHRGKGSIQAEDSFIWSIQRSGLQAKFSVDCPWDDWHDLSHCYSGLGWNVEMSHHFDDESSWGPAGFSVLRLSKPTGEIGIVFFASVDRHGRQVVPRFTGGFYSSESVIRQVVGSIKRQVGRSDENLSDLKGIELPVTAFQLACFPKSKLGQSDVSALRQMFHDCCASVLKSDRFRD